MTTGRELLIYGVAQLGQEKRLEAEMLLASVLSCGRAHLLAHDDEEVTEMVANEYKGLVQRRKNDEPLQYILGTTSFMGMDLVVTPAVLIPRFDTEILVEQAIELSRGLCDPKWMVDICTGSGAIAISLAKYVKGATVWASDLSAEALAVAEENNKRQQTNVAFRCGDLFEPFQEDAFYHRFGLIASNPPYITTGEMQGLPDEVLMEPSMALWGGDDGLIFYRRLVRESGRYLADEGWLLMEIGFAQGQAVQQLMLEAGFEQVKIIQDWQGHDRVVRGMWRITNSCI